MKNKNKTRKKLRVEESERKGKIREGKKKSFGVWVLRRQRGKFVWNLIG